MASKRREQAKQTAAIIETAGVQDRILAELAALREGLTAMREDVQALGEKIASLSTKDTKSTKGKKSEETE